MIAFIFLSYCARRWSIGLVVVHCNRDTWYQFKLNVFITWADKGIVGRYAETMQPIWHFSAMKFNRRQMLYIATSSRTFWTFFWLAKELTFWERNCLLTLAHILDRNNLSLQLFSYIIILLIISSTCSINK